jgi:hypothetical protein
VIKPVHKRKRKNRVSLSMSWQIHAGRPRLKENAAEAAAENFEERYLIANDRVSVIKIELSIWWY